MTRTRILPRVTKSAVSIAAIAVIASGCSLGIGSGNGPADGDTGQEQAEQSQDGGAEDSETPEDAEASDSGQSDEADDADEAAEAGDAAASDGGGEAVVDEDTAAAGVDPSTVGDPIASAEGPAIVPGDPEATMTVNLHSLTRSGETVVAVYSFQVHSTHTDHEGDLFNYIGAGWNPFLIDTKNLNRHDVMTGGGSAQTRYIGPEFRPGQTFYAFAVFAAPPADVTTMDASLGEGTPMATEVPLR